MRIALHSALLFAFVALFAACSGASPDRGYDLRLRVPGAQLVRAPLPTDNGGPKLTLVDLRDTQVGAGDTGNPIFGRAAGGTFAINVTFDGDPAYWVVPVGLPDDVNPGENQFRVVIDYARSLPPGPIRVLLQAVDGQGRPGPVSVARLLVLPTIPDGELVFSLEWDAEVDADLLVLDPSGVLIGPKDISSSVPPAPGAPLPNTQDASVVGVGQLDQDSNANCVIDGRRRENIVWTSAPPRGRYTVYVALASTCGLSRSAFRVKVSFGGRERRFTDVLYASDGRSQPLAPALSPGLLVTTLDVP